MGLAAKRKGSKLCSTGARFFSTSIKWCRLWHCCIVSSSKSLWTYPRSPGREPSRYAGGSAPGYLHIAPTDNTCCQCRFEEVFFSVCMLPSYFLVPRSVAAREAERAIEADLAHQVVSSSHRRLGLSSFQEGDFSARTATFLREQGTRLALLWMPLSRAGDPPSSAFIAIAFTLNVKDSVLPTLSRGGLDGAQDSVQGR